jgi:hypothetical protein
MPRALPPTIWPDADLAEVRKRMDARVPPDTPAENMTPPDREARWTLRVWLAIEAPTEHEARGVLNQALAGLRMEIPVRRESATRSRRPGRPDDLWVAEVEPDLTHVQVSIQTTPGHAAPSCEAISPPIRDLWPLSAPNRRRGMNGRQVSGKGSPARMMYCYTPQCGPLTSRARRSKIEPQLRSDGPTPR